MQQIFHAIAAFLKDNFSLAHEQEDNLATIKSIEKGVDFKGINIWTLIFAIFVASIGLNVNSTAVIIGAMLISPLMGPIMGLGLGVGIYDFSLLKRSLKNLLVAVVISVATSALYFLVSPLTEAQSELLARTTPTIYDVLIALSGGLAGIIAGASKEKGNAIPGVAIATALMPPLCTAGYGLATGNLYFFLGAFYLFFINAVMISLSTLIIVRFLKFPQKQVVDKKRAAHVKRYISVIVVLTVLPSIYFGYKIIQQTIFNSNVQSYLNKEFNFEKTQIVGKHIAYHLTDTCSIEVILTGKEITKLQIQELSQLLNKYSLNRTKLIVKQGSLDIQSVDVGQIKSGIIEEIYHKNELVIQDKDEKIRILESALIKAQNTIPSTDIAEEIYAINPNVTQFSAYKTVLYDNVQNVADTTVMVYVSVKGRVKRNDKMVLYNWLQKRLHTNKLKLIIE